MEGRETYLTFALDRIRSLKITDQKLKPRQPFNTETYLKHAVGIIDQDGEPVAVKLRIKTPYHKLIALDPLHHSQKITETTSKSCTIQLSVHITHELHHRILAFGPHCVVISPASLKKEIKKQLAEALGQY